MKWTPAYIPRWTQLPIPQVIWSKSSVDKKLYLTFDDGPTPDVTDQVLRILSQYDIKATFFCVGQHVSNYQELYNEIIKNGHSTGNHSYSHINGWKTTKTAYLDNIYKARDYITSNLFRPPYGRLTLSQYLTLRHHYQIIMYDVMAMDYDKRLSPQDCYHNVISHLSNGSIILLHDSDKASDNVLGCIQPIIEYALENGFQFDKL